MLIEFSVTNYRSVKETQTLSMITDGSTSELPANISMVQLPGTKQKKNQPLLRSAIIYGPNASGKSTLVDALGWMRYFIINAARQQRGDEILWVLPFKFNSKTLEQPSVFEITFALQHPSGKRIKYEYGFAITKHQVVEEWLYEYRTSHATKLFVRAYDHKKSKFKWEFGGGLKAGDTSQRTLDNVLFLSKAAQDNHEYLSPIFDWFHKTLDVLPSNRENSDICRKYFRTEFSTKKPRLLQFLQDADISITDLQILQKKSDFDEKKLPPDISPEQKAYIKDQFELQLKSVHIMKDTGKKVELDFFAEESDGTTAMLALASVFIPAIDKEKVLIIDELDKSLHPLLIKALLQAFHAYSENSQLIFTTHNLHQMDEKMFRKDQIWLMEKEHQTESSSLYRLSDLKGIRKEHAFDRRYTLGAYGALPILGNFDLRTK